MIRCYHTCYTLHRGIKGRITLCYDAILKPIHVISKSSTFCSVGLFFIELMISWIESDSILPITADMKDQ